MNPVANLLINSGAVRRGQFTLSSGRESDLYVDVKAASLSVRGMYEIADDLASIIIDGDRGVQAVGGPELGAVALVGGVLVALDLYTGADVRGFIVRKAAKGHGTDRLIEGDLKPGSRCVVIEDCVTTGASVLRCVQVLRDAGHTCTRSVAVVDRQDGARELLASNGVELSALVTRAELTEGR